MNEIYILGDIHQNLRYVMYVVKMNKIKDAYLIQVGDFGVGFTKEENQIKILNELNTFLNQYNITMLVIRGNHDSPSYFNGNHNYSNLKFLPDYTQMVLNNQRFLFVGGAVSIDRKQRMAEFNLTNKETYWPDEVFKYEPEKITNNEDIDVLITHVASTEIVNYMQNCKVLNSKLVDSFVNRFMDYDLIDDTKSESDDMEKLVKSLQNLKNHYFGHYHKSFETKLDNCTFTLLNINEIKKHEL